MNTIIELKNVDKIYTAGKLSVPALLRINVAIKAAEMVAIMGPSGSGKSTLMNIIGLLDRPSGGELLIDEKAINLNMPTGKLAQLRGQKIGFVFQTFNLLPRLSALDNVLLPTLYQRGNKAEFKKHAKKLLDQVGLSARINHKPSELSGGERQRVAIARALINDPEVILADEPTGNLDSKSGQEIINILKELNKNGKTIIIITHDANIAKHCTRTIHLFDGEQKEFA
jgi:putative ABC transport system ATP-binding protein